MIKAMKAKIIYETSYDDGEYSDHLDYDWQGDSGKFCISTKLYAFTDADFDLLVERVTELARKERTGIYKGICKYAPVEIAQVFEKGDKPMIKAIKAFKYECAEEGTFDVGMIQIHSDDIPGLFISYADFDSLVDRITELAREESSNPTQVWTLRMTKIGHANSPAEIAQVLKKEMEK